MNEHPNTKCGANKTNGEGPCNNGSGKGTSHPGFGHCYKHSGSTPNGGKHAAKVEAAWRQRLTDELDPSVKFIAAIRDKKDEATRDRLSAAGKLVDTGVKVSGDDGGETSVTIVFNMDDLP